MSFFKQEVSFLGHVISDKGISTDKSKIERIVCWPTPTNLQQLQRFLGLASYYRRFIRNFATISKPLYRLTEKKANFHWTSDCDAAFSQLKELLTSAPILSFPDFSQQFILDTDASNNGIGAVLSQCKNGKEHVIAYASRSLTKAERNYSVTRRELLAVVTFTGHFRQYLLGHRFILRTDHQSLTWLTNFKNPEGQLARWLENLVEFSFHIEHRSGHKHGNADSLSRYPHNNTAAAVTVSDDSPLSLFSYLPSDIRNLQLEDDVISHVLKAKEQNSKPAKDSVTKFSIKTRKLFQLWDQLQVVDNILFRTFYSTDSNETWKQLVVPSAIQSEILEHVHAGSVGGHLGQTKMLQKLRDRFYWPGHYNDVVRWCATCSSCSTRKSPPIKAKAPLQPILVGHPMQLVAVDLLGPLPRSQNGNCYVLVATDYFTKWCEAYALPNMEATTVAKSLVNGMFLRFSPPEALHSDQGRQFDGLLIKEICRILQIRKSRTSPYHPQGDGLVERFNRTLLSMLATSTKDNPLSWEEYLQPVCFAYNTSCHSSTGFTPFYLMYGREARLPVDLQFGVHSPNTEDLSPINYSRQMQMSLYYAFQKVRETLGYVQQRQKTLYDRHIHGNPYAEGDTVWLYSTVVPNDNHRKLYHPWTGPYKVLSKLSDITYKIAPTHDLSKTSVVHFDRLKKCHLRTLHSIPHSPISYSDHQNIGEHARLLDYPEDDLLNDTPPLDSPLYGTDPLNSSNDDSSDTLPDSPLSSPTPSLSTSPSHHSPRYPTRHRFPPDRGPFVSH